MKTQKQVKSKKPTVYIIDLTTGDMTTAAKVTARFVRAPEEFRWDFCNSSKEYIYRMEEQGDYVVVKQNGYIMSNKILTPKQYGEIIKVNIPANVSLAKFDEVIADRYNLWNYPINEYKHVVENGLKVVVVRFSNGECRLVEIR
jgi:hypothetical protein